MSIIQFNPKATLDLVTRSQWRAVDLDIWSPMGKGGRKGLNLLYGIDKRDHVTNRALLGEKDFLRRVQVLFATLKGRHPQFVDEHKLHTLHDVQWNLCELQKYLCPQQARAYVPQAQPAPHPAKRRRVVPLVVATDKSNGRGRAWRRGQGCEGCDYSIAQLRQLAKQHGVSQCGTKQMLWDRLKEHGVRNPD